MNMFSKQISLQGQLVNYLVRPGVDSKTAVFLHGWRSSAEAWRDVFTRLDKDIAAYALDLPGFGKSEMPQHPFSVSDYAAVVGEFITKLGLTNVTLIGHSFGGRTAIKLAVMDPKLISKIVLVDAAGVRKASSSRSAAGIFAKIVKPLFKLPGFRALRPKIYKAIGAEDYVATPELKDTFVKVINEDLSPLLPSIKQSTLVIWGDRDLETPINQGKGMAKKIPNARFEIISGAGHFSFTDNPSQFMEILHSFVL